MDERAFGEFKKCLGAQQWHARSVVWPIGITSFAMALQGVQSHIFGDMQVGAKAKGGFY